MREEIDADTLSHIFFLQGKQVVREKRRRAEAERKRRRPEARNED
jgi:hypothetical protein